jgi:hypothetical protein
MVINNIFQVYILLREFDAKMIGRLDIMLCWFCEQRNDDILNTRTYIMLGTHYTLRLEQEIWVWAFTERLKRRT